MSSPGFCFVFFGFVCLSVTPRLYWSIVSYSVKKKLKTNSFACCLLTLSWRPACADDLSCFYRPLNTSLCRRDIMRLLKKTCLVILRFTHCNISRYRDSAIWIKGRTAHWLVWTSLVSVPVRPDTSGCLRRTTNAANVVSRLFMC